MSDKDKRRRPPETGAVLKEHGGRLSVALCYPNRYAVAMGNLGVHQVYHLLNERVDVVCERCMTDVTSAAVGSAMPVTIETGTPINRFEIIAVSISYEADLPNLASMLAAAGVPADPELRERVNSPLVLIGGPMAFLNPEPLAVFADLVAVGEAESILDPLLDAYLDLRGASRKETLYALAAVPGVYAPSLYEIEYGKDGSILERRPARPGVPETVTRMFARTLDPPARTRVFTREAEFGDMCLVELGRGCINSCRFCAAAYIYRPPRFTPLSALGRVFDQTAGKREKVGLVAASATDHPEFDGIRAMAAARGMRHSVASLRLDGITAELLADIREQGHKTLTVAPESGSERLRRVINKPLTDAAFLEAMELVGALDIPRLKIYLQVGLPFEEDGDTDVTADLMARAREALDRGARTRRWPGRISFSINPFVPKPNTPFQWHAMEPAASLKRRLNRLRKRLNSLDGSEVSGTSVREAVLQAAISRGDRRTGILLAQAARTGEKPLRGLERVGDGAPGADWYLLRRRSFDERLPWDFIDQHVSKEYLWREYERALEARATPPCRPGKCALCDACRDRSAPDPDS